jgi:LysM repeat protein
MGTTYGPSDRGYQGISGRSGRDAKVVPLNRYQQQLTQRATPRVVRQGGEPSRLIPWPGRRTPDAPEAQVVSHGRRRRRSSPLRQWMPTILFAGVAATLALLLLAVRMMLASSAPTPAPAAAAPAQVEQVAVAAQAREALGAPLPNTNPAPAPTSTIRFTSKPIEPSYTVAANDNLWSIAQKNRTTAEAIQAINNLPERATLHIGDRLVIP